MLLSLPYYSIIPEFPLLIPDYMPLPKTSSDFFYITFFNICFSVQFCVYKMTKWILYTLSNPWSSVSFLYTALYLCMYTCVYLDNMRMRVFMFSSVRMGILFMILIKHKKIYFLKIWTVFILNLFIAIFCVKFLFLTKTLFLIIYNQLWIQN